MEKLVKKPWGSYQNILDEDYTKVKKIIINPGESPSYQYHFKRSEIWVLVKGTGKVKIDDEVHYYREGDVVFIPKEAKHQMTNIGDADLIFIEVQLGESFEEEDIVRLEDKYGRL
jgi:mannose-6-phosphate isomerase-like protein (cupin superfamily)